MTAEEFDELPLLLRRRQVVASTGFSRDTIYALLQSGQLTATRVNGEGPFLYHKESVARFVKPVSSG